MAACLKTGYFSNLSSLLMLPHTYTPSLLAIDFFKELIQGKGAFNPHLPSPPRLLAPQMASLPVQFLNHVDTVPSRGHILESYRQVADLGPWGPERNMLEAQGPLGYSICLRRLKYRNKHHLLILEWCLSLRLLDG